MLEEKIMGYLRAGRIVNKEELAVHLRNTMEANMETVFRTLRRLAEEGKIVYVGDGNYRYELKDDKTESLTKWIQ
jgi:Fe2+ or Zn2+ uptake regulation protein